MRLVCFGFTGMLIIGFAFAIPLFLSDVASAQNQNQNQNLTPSMVINMSDLSIKVGNTTSNKTLTFSNNTTNQSGSSSS